ncbi:unnamed protein product, partial [Phaeothamnion confervicola]
MNEAGGRWRPQAAGFKPFVRVFAEPDLARCLSRPSSGALLARRRSLGMPLGFDSDSEERTEAATTPGKSNAFSAPRSSQPPSREATKKVWHAPWFMSRDSVFTAWRDSSSVSGAAEEPAALPSTKRQGLSPLRPQALFPSSRARFQQNRAASHRFSAATDSDDSADSTADGDAHNSIGLVGALATNGSGPAKQDLIAGAFMEDGDESVPLSQPAVSYVGPMRLFKHESQQLTGAFAASRQALAAATTAAVAAGEAGSAPRPAGSASPTRRPPPPSPGRTSEADANSLKRLRELVDAEAKAEREMLAGDAFGLCAAADRAVRNAAGERMAQDALIDEAERALNVDGGGGRIDVASARRLLKAEGGGDTGRLPDEARLQECRRRLAAIEHFLAKGRAAARDGVRAEAFLQDAQRCHGTLLEQLGGEPEISEARSAAVAVAEARRRRADDDAAAAAEEQRRAAADA